MKTTYPEHVKDHFLTQEEFQLAVDPQTGILGTIPQPTPEEVGRYYESTAYLSHDDSGQGWFGRIYRSIKSINLKRKTNLLHQYKKGYKKVLDIGCGTGDFLSALPPHILRTGIEINPKAATIARTKELEVFDNIDQTDTTYDVITLWHVLEHLYDLPDTIEKIKNKLDENGLLIIALPNYRSYDARYYRSYWAGYDVPRHLWHFDKSSLSELMKSKNMHVVNFLPMYWDAYYVSLLSEKYKRNPLAPLSAFLIGSISNLKSLFSKEPSSIIYMIRKNTE